MLRARPALVALTSAILSGLQFVPAEAACTPAIDGVIATCSGTTTNQGTGNPAAGVGYGGFTIDDATVNVLDGATVTGTEAGLRFGAGLTVDNKGTISTPSASGAGINAFSIKSLTNAGTIAGVGSGVGTDAIDTVTNLSSGVIQGGVSGRGLSVSGSAGTITNDGRISGGLGGVNISGALNSLVNHGQISGAPNGNGLYADSIVTATNSGSITGMYALISNSIQTLTNTASGTISGDRGVAGGNIETLTNAGHISGRAAIFLNVGAQHLGTLVNTASGTITGMGDWAVFANTIDRIENQGAITSSGPGSAIQALAALGSLKNAGTITASGDAIRAASIQSLDNSGAIVSTGQFSGTAVGGTTIGTVTNSGLLRGVYAIRETGIGNTTLNLNAGSIVIGKLDLGGGLDTLNVGPGLSINNTFDDGAPVIGRTAGAYVVSGNRVAVLDPTNLANHTEMLVDLTDGIFSTLQGRIAGLSAGSSGASSAGGFPAPMNLGARAPRAEPAPARNAGQYWAQAFGSHRGQQGSSATASSEQEVAGFVSGLDAHVSATTLAGFFAGGAWGDAKADLASQSTDAESYFGGAYLSASFGATSFDLAIVGGRSTFDRDRRIANNTLPTGLESATAEYDGWFISPEARLTEHLRLGGQKIEASVSARYAGLFLDGFTETGATDGLSIDSRDLHLGVARATLALPLEHTGNGWLARLTLAGGVEGRTQIGDAGATGVLLGQGIDFEPGDDDAVGVFAGATAEVVTASGTSVFAQFEGLTEDDGSERFGGKAGFRLPF